MEDIFINELKWLRFALFKQIKLRNLPFLTKRSRTYQKWSLTDIDLYR